MEKVIYYQDELNDEFSEAVIEPIPIDENYRYLRDGFGGKFLHVFWFHIIAVPLATIYMKLWFGHKVVNGKKLKNYYSVVVLYAI